MGSKTNIPTLQPPTQGMDYGNKPYISNKPYPEQTRQLTTAGVMSNAGKFPESEFNFPTYDTESYEEMEYWFPWTFDFNWDWSLYPIPQLDALPPYVEIPEEEEEAGPVLTNVWAAGAYGPGVFASLSIYRANNADWATVHDSASGAVDVINLFAEVEVDGGGLYDIYRMFFWFDTPTLPGNVTAVELHGTWTTLGTGTYHIYESTHTRPGNGADYSGGFGATSFGSVVNPSGAEKITLNSAGIDYINSKSGGTAKLCIREFGYDVSDIDPVGAMLNQASFSVGAFPGNPIGTEADIHLHITTV